MTYFLLFLVWIHKVHTVTAHISSEIEVFITSCTSWSFHYFFVFWPLAIPLIIANSPKMRKVETKRINTNWAHPLCCWLLIQNCSQFISLNIGAFPTARLIILLSRLGHEKLNFWVCDSRLQGRRLMFDANRYVTWCHFPTTIISAFVIRITASLKSQVIWVGHNYSSNWSEWRPLSRSFAKIMIGRT